MKEFAFDIQLVSVARVLAETEEEARKKMHNIIDCIELGYEEGDIKITEASQDQSKRPYLFEIDGEAPPIDEDEAQGAAELEAWRLATSEELSNGFWRFQNESDGTQSNAETWAALCRENGISL